MTIDPAIRPRVAIVRNFKDDPDMAEATVHGPFRSDGELAEFIDAIRDSAFGDCTEGRRPRHAGPHRLSGDPALGGRARRR